MTDPRFARLRPKLDRARNELKKLHRFLASIESGDKGSDVEWGKVVVIAQSLSNVYNGMEDVMSEIARDVDGSVPSGDAWHADLLDQMSVPLDEVRPALLDGNLLRDMVELKGFRHLTRHRYGIELRADLTLENLARLEKTFPAFVEAVEALARYLDEEPEPPKRADG